MKGIALQRAFAVLVVDERGVDGGVRVVGEVDVGTELDACVGGGEEEREEKEGLTG